jgi:23S rRNA (adenine2503-C2)-methyltransferase
MSKDLKEKTLGELEQIVLGLGQTSGELVEPKKYLAEYIFHFIHNEAAKEISQITPLSKAFRAQLTDQGYYISQIALADKLTDKDGTAKYVFALGDGSRIEVVLLLDGREKTDDRRQRAAISHPFSVICMEGKRQTTEDRGQQSVIRRPSSVVPRRTICVSTQVGCALGCLFCATGRLGFRRNLTAAEIVDQVNAVQAEAGRITNVVYMGMGEPLLNYSAVLKSVAILNHPKGKNIGIRRLTTSTCGISPAIRKLASEDLHPKLAVSLNAPSDALRTQLMPINAKYPIAELLKAVRFYQDKTRQRVSFEYVMIKGLNDSAEHARMLVNLLRGLMCHVNLIEHNPYPGCEFAGSGSERIRRFASILERAGIETTVRFRMGRGIRAACGQLGADWLDG